MNPQAEFPPATKSPREVDRICDRFESMWREGQRPRLDDFLNTVDESIRREAFGELLPLDADYRTDGGEAVSAEAYIERFPAFQETIQSFFQARTINETLTRIETQPSPESVSDTLPLGKFGNYEILAEIARGGMGAVYKARQGGLDRLVAIKVILSGPGATPAYIERFLAEARTAARLQHPAIVSIVEVGQIDGRYFFSMEFLPGETLAEIAKRGPIPSEQAVRYARDIAEAVHYAHERGVLHRDLKPSNVMVDASGRLKVMDFGLAKLVEGSSQLTRDGDLLGTPSYMSPEQASGNWPHVDRRTDVYALGAILYELLTGQPPYLGKSPVATMVQVIHDPPRAPREIKPGIDPRLEEIVLRCLAKDPAARYATAAELAADLEKFLTTAPMPAASNRGLPPWHFSRRVVGGALAGAAACFLAIVLIVRDQQGRTKVQVPLTPGDKLEIVDGSILPERTRTRPTDSEAAPAAVLNNALPVEIDPEPLLFKDGEPLSAAALVSNPAPIEGVKSWTIETRGHRSVVDAVAFNPGGEELVSCGRDGTLRFWQTANGRLLRIVFAPPWVSASAWSHDGRYLATAHGDATVRLWRVAEGRLLRTVGGQNGAATSLAWSPDGHRLAAGTGGDKSVRVWSVADGELSLTLAGHSQSIRQVAWSPDGRLLASADEGGVCRMCEAETGNLVHTITQKGAIRAIAWSPTGSSLAIAADAGVQLWNMASEGTPQSVELAQANVTSLRWLADGKTLVAAGLDGAVQYWDTDESQSRRSFQVEKTGGATFRALAISPDGKHLGAAVDNGTGTVQIIDARSGKQSLIVGHDFDTPLWNYAAPPLDWSQHENLIAYGSSNGEVAVWDADAGGLRAAWSGHFGPLVSIAWAPVGDTLASGGSDNLVRLWTSHGKKLSQEFTQGGWTSGLAWSPDAAHIASSGPGGTINIWKAVDGTRVGTFEHPSPVVLAWSPDGNQLLSGGYDGTVRLWNVDTQKPLKTFDCDQNEQKFGEIHSVAWSHDGKQLAAGGAGSIWVWDTESGALLAPLKGLPGWVYSIRWSPDGRLLAAGCGNTALICDAESRELKQTLSGRAALVPGVSWSPDGRYLATSTLGPRGIQVWEAAPGRLHSIYLPLAGSQGVALTPEGHCHHPSPNDDELMYVVLTDAGQETLPPDEFTRRYGWKNDPNRTRLAD